MGCGETIIHCCIIGILILGCIACSILEVIMLFSNGFLLIPFVGSMVALIGICVRMTTKKYDKDSLEIFEQVCGLTFLFGVIQFGFFMRSQLRFGDGEELFMIFLTCVFAQPAKCLIGYWVSNEIKASRKSNLIKYRERLYNYYHKQADVLREAVRNIDELKNVSNATENLIELLLRCGCTVLRTSFQDLDLSRNVAFVDSLKDSFAKAELDVISDSMSIAEIREEAEKQILEKQKKYNYYHTEYYNEADYKKIKAEYNQVIRKRKPLTCQTIKLTVKKCVVVIFAFGAIAIVLVAVKDMRRKNAIYEEALSYQKVREYVKANDLFESIRGYKDVNDLIEEQKFEVEHQRIKKASVGDIVTFGECNDEILEVNGPIEWIVLDKKNGVTLLISKEILVHKPYDESVTATTWETSTLRKWLNTTFCQNVFNEKEFKWVRKNVTENTNNSIYKTSAGNNTEDRIFLLSNYEAAKLLSSKMSSDWWWLRTPGEQENYAARVSLAGDIQQRGVIVTENGGVRPAMWVS